MKNQPKNEFPSWRLERIEQLKGRYALLPPEQIVHLLNPIKQALKEYPNATYGWSLVRQVNIAALQPDEVRPLLHSLFHEPPVECYLLWLTERVGLNTSLDLFIRYYDDFYYPSSDDLAVTDSFSSFVLFFDHEEIISYYKRGAIKESERGKG